MWPAGLRVDYFHFLTLAHIALAWVVCLPLFRRIRDRRRHGPTMPAPESDPGQVGGFQQELSRDCVVEIEHARLPLVSLEVNDFRTTLQKIDHADAKGIVALFGIVALAKGLLVADPALFLPGKVVMVCRLVLSGVFAPMEFAFLFLPFSPGYNPIAALLAGGSLWYWWKRIHRFNQRKWTLAERAPDGKPALRPLLRMLLVPVLIFTLGVGLQYALWIDMVKTALNLPKLPPGAVITGGVEYGFTDWFVDAQLELPPESFPALMAGYSFSKMESRSGNLAANFRLVDFRTFPVATAWRGIRQSSSCGIYVNATTNLVHIHYSTD